jgi:hypothetical protein
MKVLEADANDGLLQQMYHNFGFFFSINSLFGPDLRVKDFFS